MKATATHLILLTSIYSTCACQSAFADMPLGWLNSDNPSAFTLDAMSFDINVSKLAVNESLDVFKIRDTVLAGTRQLGGKTGDLDGNKITAQFGITSSLTAFYERQQTDLTIELGSISSINLLSIDSVLSTSSTSYGFRWNFFESGYFDNASAWHAASFEISKTHNSTKDYSAMIDEIYLSSGSFDVVISFTNPQTFGLRNLNDDGLKARFLYTMPLTEKITGNFWAGYAETDSTSATDSDIGFAAIARAFEQTFAIQDRQITLGGGLNWQITPRLPLQISYEYIRVNNIDSQIVFDSTNTLLPSFLRASNLSTTTNDNHTVRGSLSYWLTPQFNLSLTAKVFSHQFLGVVPHYNNPLSGSFADKPYGYVGLQLGFRL